MDKISKDGQVFFNDAEHKYTDKDGNRLLSITQLISHFKEKFDESGIITEKYAKKHGLTVTEVKEKWKEINEQSCFYGTSVHESLEHFINNGTILDNEYKSIVEQFSKYKFEGKLHSEVMVHSVEHMIAGTVDIIEKLPNKEINIWDFKTNKKIERTNSWGKKMKHCLFYLEDANFVHYCIQMSLYAYLCELKGLKVKNLFLLYMNPKTQKFELFDCPYMKDEVKMMLKYKEKNITY